MKTAFVLSGGAGHGRMCARKRSHEAEAADIVLELDADRLALAVGDGIDELLGRCVEAAPATMLGRPRSPCRFGDRTAEITTLRRKERPTRGAN